MKVTRRDFIKGGVGAGVGVAAAAGLLGQQGLRLRALEPALEVGNPLEYYPDRSWEGVYQDQYQYDSSFTWVCSPNDTHSCRVRSFVRNGVVIRSEQNYDVHKYGDLYGNKATTAWNPRMCPKGYTMHRRLYGPYRLKYPMIRQGWKHWADDGFPKLTPDNKTKYKFDARGQDELLRISWDDANTYIARVRAPSHPRRAAPNYHGPLCSIPSTISWLENTSFHLPRAVKYPITHIFIFSISWIFITLIGRRT